MWPAPMRNACGSTTYSCLPRRTAKPLHGPAPGRAWLTAGGKTGRALAAKGRARTDRGKEIPARAIRPTKTIRPRASATTARLAASAGRKDQPSHTATDRHGLMLTTAHPEGVAARPEGPAGATAGVAHDSFSDSFSGYARGDTHVHTRHFG